MEVTVMAMISTRQLFEEFFAEQQDESYVKRTRGQVYRPEVFAYEEKIGKHVAEHKKSPRAGSCSEGGCDKRTVTLG